MLPRRHTLLLVLDVRDGEAIEKPVSAAASYFQGVDICVNNASAINVWHSIDIPPSRFDLVQQINVRAAFLVSRPRIPYLKRSDNHHILTRSPPLNSRPHRLARHLPYTLSKYGMTLVALGLDEEFRTEGIASNALWPRTTIASAAVEFAPGGKDALNRYSTPEVMADAVYAILRREALALTANCVVDEEVLRSDGAHEFERYRHDPSTPLETDLFVDGDRR